MITLNITRAELQTLKADRLHVSQMHREDARERFRFPADPEVRLHYNETASRLRVLDRIIYACQQALT